MDHTRRLLLLLMLPAVIALDGWDDSECDLQREVIPSDSKCYIQRPIIPREFLDMMKQRTLESLTERKKGPQIRPTSMDPSIPFPPARPTMNNIIAICHYSNLRPRYTKDILPKNGFGYLYRQASAVNQLESWFSVCCSNGTQDEEMLLCCAKQAWEISLSNFCKEEFSIKTSHYYCCKRNDQEILDCFEEAAPNPSYQPPDEKVSPTRDFNFNSSSCGKTSASEIIPNPEMVTEHKAHRRMKQRTVTHQIPKFVQEEDVLPHHESSLSIWPPITFPLARPTTTNIHAICQYSNYRPRHSKDRLPSSGSGHLHRQASAVNQLESWYTVCCTNGNQDVELTLCCAQQAWERSLSNFCEEEFSNNTSPYHCCKKKELARWDCFEKAASDTYNSSGSEAQYSNLDLRSIDFVPKSCQKTSISGAITKREIKKDLISFPPGRPNAGNIEPICTFHKDRHHLFTHCLPQTEYDWFGHQIKAINNLEKGFGKCCKQNKHIQVCTEEKWKKMVDRFCKDEKKNQANQYKCCKKQRGEAQYDCFSTAAPDPQYMPKKYFGPRPSLDMFCVIHQTLQKIKRFPFNVAEMAEKCCILVEDERSTCLQIQLNIHLDDACKADNPSVTQVKQNCCRKAAKERTECLTKILLHNIAKATKVTWRCPDYT
ncbi:extracellular matrix protein 1 [Tachysurus fulvidraco]|uniref:extracellular matrix protein 1 n=1 Tax=Tachysurus fulvidraco TaxID=1234273 RepID=UPI000F5054FA|nr:extracellular matrix protein 1 [Tachysurus fulvidraco]